MTAVAESGTMPGMAKSSKGGKHKTPRKPVQIPVTWLTRMRATARTKPMPLMWYLVKLYEKDATASGEGDFPQYPWEEDPAAAERKKKAKE